MKKDKIEELLDMTGDLLSSYDGDDLGDSDLIGFSPIQKVFGSQIDASRQFTMTITNATDTDDQFYLNPSYRISETDSGHPLSNKGTGGNALSFAGSPTDVAAFYRYLAVAPVNAMGLRLQSDNSAQVQAVLKSYQFGGPVDPVGKFSQINFASATDETAQRTDVATIKQQISFDRNTNILMPILKNTTVTITIFMGAMLDTAKVLQKQATKAIRQNAAPSLQNRTRKFLRRR